jgi:hypothetical protein
MPSSRAGLLLCFATAFVIPSCRSGNIEDHPIVIEAETKLEASVGSDVHWTFKATRGGRLLQIKDISASILPFGVKSNYQNMSYTGKVLGRQIRSGFIKVTAFDKESCLRNFELMKTSAVKNTIAGGGKDVTVPTSPCDLKNQTSVTQAGDSVSTGYFRWHMTGGPDTATDANIKELLLNLSRAAARAKQSTNDSSSAAVVAKKITKKSIIKPMTARTPTPIDKISVTDIPFLESPHTTEVVIGTCAKFKRQYCGTDKDCLWYGATCISKNSTGRLSKEGMTK